jgi:(p)ppGpp synthase/HD superfamily hydrolase
MRGDFTKIREYAEKCHDDANCKYAGGSYMIHVDKVVYVIETYQDIFLRPIDAEITKAAAYGHDLIEDAKQTVSEIKEIMGIDAARVVLRVTDVPAENRLMKHLLTMGKTVEDYRAIILKMADIWSNATFSKISRSSMYGKYVEEYKYRKPIFQLGLKWYTEFLDQEILKQLWAELDYAHGVKGTYLNLKLE